MRTTILILAALTVIAMLALACNEQDIAGQNEAAKGDSNAAGRDSDAIDIFDLRTGDCFADVPDGRVVEVALYPCADPRADLKVTGMAFIEQDGDYPGLDWIDERVSRECSLLGEEAIYPRQESWEKGDRTILCLRKLRSPDEPTYTADEPTYTKEEVAGLVGDTLLPAPYTSDTRGFVTTYWAMAQDFCNDFTTAPPGVFRNEAAGQGESGWALFEATYQGEGIWHIGAQCYQIPSGGGQSTEVNVTFVPWSFREATGQVIRLMPSS